MQFQKKRASGNVAFGLPEFCLREVGSFIERGAEVQFIFESESEIKGKVFECFGAEGAFKDKIWADLF